MQLEATTFHAVQILCHLHKHQEADKAMNIARSVGITSPNATRIMARLKRYGYVKSISGHRGGYTLGMRAEEISFYDVFLALEGDPYSTHCLADSCTHESRNCKTHKFLTTLQNNVIEEMLGTSIDDLV
ncbi:MAG: Rrf2 family transcriptional regulator [Oscillospiraceae bacterium]|nr:Rrf2 family transcriptional regulator [Oscillospiraceae bacterium]